MLIEKHNMLDIMLYNSAKKITLQRIKQQGPIFENEIKIFQKSNKIYVKFCSFNRKAKKIFHTLPETMQVLIRNLVNKISL